MSANPILVSSDTRVDLSPEAALVREALVERGLETPMLDNGLSPRQKYQRIKSLMTDVVNTLGLDLGDDSLAETPHRIAKMYVDVPKDKVIGLSKINRLVRFFGQRPQVQERLTRQILVALQVLLGTDDVAVAIDATHYCVKARGVMDTGSRTRTSALGGVFQREAAVRAEFLAA